MNYPLMQKPELTAAFNTRFGFSKTVDQIKSTLKNHKITCGRPTGTFKGNHRLYTSEQVKWLHDNCRGKSYAELTEAFNLLFEDDKAISQIAAFIGNQKLNTGRTGCFEKGHKPWNDGTKGQGICKPNSGNFKPGSIPPNLKPLWDERICSKDGFILMKVPERNPYTGFTTRYKHKHVWIWEQANGPVPKGMKIAFVDSDKLHCDLDNLMLVSANELLMLNLHHYAETPSELKPSVLALAKLEAKAGFRTTGRQPGAGCKRKERPL